MALLRNNNVYVCHLTLIQGWYQNYQEMLYQQTEHVKLFISYSNCFEEDLKAAINYYNGILHRSELDNYLKATVCSFDESLATNLNLDYNRYFTELRTQFFERFLDVLYEFCEQLFPELPGLPSQDIFLACEKAHFFILDRRRQTYVPKELFTVVRRFNDESALTDDEWVF